MFTDNYGLLSLYMKNKNCFFLRMTLDGRAYYVAGNRAARRYALSSRVKSLGLNVSVDPDGTVTVS